MLKTGCAFLFLIASLTACATTHIDNNKNYFLGHVRSTNIGTPLISNKIATYTRSWGGCLGPGVMLPPGATFKDGYIEQYSGESFQEDLIYTGKSGNTIHISYREYKRDFARPAFFQELQYDLNESQLITFKSYTVKVLEATNQFIKYIVVSD